MDPECISFENGVSFLTIVTFFWVKKNLFLQNKYVVKNRPVATEEFIQEVYHQVSVVEADFEPNAPRTTQRRNRWDIPKTTMGRILNHYLDLQPYYLQR